MAKLRKQIAATKSNELQRVEHNEVFDDNLLPDANEIEKLSALDPGILPWLKERAEKEQDFRHRAFDSRLKLADKHNSKDHSTTRLALIIYFILVGGCISASYLLLDKGKNLQGSLFGGAAVVLGLAVLISRGKSSKNQDASTPK